MGRSKQLLPLNDKPVIRHCFDVLLSAGLDDIVVVVSSPENGVIHALRGLPVTIAVNNAPGSEMAESVRAGLRAIDGYSSGVLVCLSDHPLVSGETIETVLQQHLETPGAIVIPSYQGKRGHPTLFPKQIITEIFFAATLRDIIRNHAQAVRTADVDDEGVILDIDTEENYRVAVEKAGSRR
ncbi:MAG TPA: nucleotidyltransferase family protein [Nitrospirota bacterium]